MIHPFMKKAGRPGRMKACRHATLLCFITTDISISKPMLESALSDAADDSFNMISVDGDMSTNDSLVIMANGLAGNRKITKADKDYRAFLEALKDICISLAKMLAADGEGATKLVEIKVVGAKNDADARMIARKISTSNLLKCAIFGEDPNWGRVAAAAGSAGVDFDPSRTDIYLGPAKVLSDGSSMKTFDKEKVRKYIKGKEVLIKVDLKSGKGSATAMDLRFFKRVCNDQLGVFDMMQEAIKKSGVLIEALPYIKKFFGKIVVIKYGGAAVDEKGIDRGILEDIMFMNFAGMHPVIVHGGGPFISRMMKKAGLEPKFINGRRFTDGHAIRIIDKALHTINRKIVSELRGMGARAFGLSGSENNLIKVKKLTPGYDLGFVGQVTSVDTTVVKRLLNDNMVPVIYPLAHGRDGELYNVNADDVASAIAAKLKAEKFVLLTNVMGIMTDKNDPQDALQYGEGFRRRAPHQEENHRFRHDTESRSVRQRHQGGRQEGPHPQRRHRACDAPGDIYGHGNRNGNRQMRRCFNAMSRRWFCF